MALTPIQAIAVAKGYTDETVIGGGAIKGKNCVVDSIADITNGHRVNFKWTLDDGTEKTGYMDVADGADGLGIKSVDINDSNHLIITYDDDTTHDAGEIQGGGGSASWGGITGTLSNQTDLQNELNTKVNAVNVAALKSNVICIAHRGLYTDIKYANTKKAFTDAFNAGFNWIEIDIRQTHDNRFVLAHDETMTMYNNGTSVSVTFANADYSSIKDYTFDSEGLYHLCTFEEAIILAKYYGMKVILDRKTGSNVELLNICCDYGMINNIVATISLTPSADEKSILSRFKDLSVRVVPSNYSSMLTLMSEVKNTLYADINATNTTHRKNYLAIALACHIPVLFSECYVNNQSVYLNVANGIMTGTNEFINVSQMISRFDDNRTFGVDISTSVDSENSHNISVGDEVIITASCNCNDKGGYINAYSLNPSIITLEQTTFGNSISVKLTAVAVGNTKIRFLNSGVSHDLEYSANAGKTLSYINVAKTQDMYKIGDVIDTSDIVVTAYYSDGTNANVTNDSIIDTSGITPGTSGHFQINVSYTYKSVTDTKAIDIFVSDTSTFGVYTQRSVINGADNSPRWNGSAPNRVVMVTETPNPAVIANSGNQRYLIPIPADTTRIDVQCPLMKNAIQLYDSTPVKTYDPGWTTDTGRKTYDINADTYSYFACNFKYPDESSTENADISEFMVVFS